MCSFRFLSKSRILSIAFSRCFKGFYLSFHGAKSSHLIRYSSVPFLVRFSSTLCKSHFSSPSVRIGSGFGSSPPSEPRKHRASSSKIVDSEKNRHCCGSIFHQRSSLSPWLWNLLWRPRFVISSRDWKFHHLSIFFYSHDNLYLLFRRAIFDSLLGSQLPLHTLTSFKGLVNLGRDVWGAQQYESPWKTSCRRTQKWCSEPSESV